MRKNLKILAIIFSVVLNIIFTGSYFYHSSGLLPLVNRQASYVHPLYEKLNLDRDQINKFEPLRNSLHAFINKQGQKIKSKQLEFVKLLAKENPDRLAIEAKQQVIRALQHEMQSRMIEHLLAESRIFTPDQRQRFFALIEGRIEKSDGSRPRWMRRGQAISSKGNRP